MRKFIAAFKLLCLAILCLLTIPVQMFLMHFSKGKIAYFLPQFWHYVTCQIFRLKIKVSGRPVSDKQVFFVGNHLSHFDIFALGSFIRASFVAKDDLGKWPGVSLLCRLQQTALISRSSGQASQARNNVQSMVEEGKSIILFPEGTSTRGETVLDFKSSLFSIPIQYAERGLLIQPFTIILKSVDGKPADTKELRDLYAWDRDNTIELGPHMWNFMMTKGASLEIIFHDPITIQPGEDRKELAKRVQEIVARPLQTA